jgi:hypothetical protein
MHHAAGSCLLCAGLMLGTGSAIAAADPNSGAHSGGSAGGSATNGQDRTGRPNTVRTVKTLPAAEVGNHLADVLRKTINDVTSILNSGRISSQQTSVSAAPKTNDAAASATTGTDNSSATTTASDTTATPPASSDTTPVSDPTVPAPEAPAPAPAPEPAPAPVATPAAPPVPVRLVPLIVTPVVDVITSVQDMLTSVVDYAAAPMSADLSSLLGVTQWQPMINGRTDAPATPAGTAGMALTPLSFASPAPGYVTANAGAAGLSAGSSTGVATSGNIEGTSTGQESTAPAQTPLIHTGAVPMTLKQFFRYAVDEVLRSPSLSALAALALPGLIGLIIILGAGMRFGYRQAKAALALPASSLARFARPQPLRLVRSRSSAAVRRPALRFVPAELSAVDCPMENAA